MAGIGFELRKLTNTDSFFNLVRANICSSVLSSGSWVISISILVGIYFYLVHKIGLNLFSIQFLVAVTYLVSSSLILSAVFQFVVNRYIADKTYEKKYEDVTPAMLTASLALLIISTLIGYFFVQLLLNHQNLIIKLTIASSFVVLNVIWTFTNALSGLKNYRFILYSYITCYSLVFLLATLLYPYQLEGLLFSFYFGHIVLFILYFVFVFRNYPCNSLFSLELWPYMKKHRYLVFSALFFQLGVWIDKYCFWYSSSTSLPMLDGMRSSPIYDMPIFLAFITMLPGLSVLFYEVEANFSRYYHSFYDAIREGATLDEIKEKYMVLLSMGRNVFLNVVKVQLLVIILANLLAPEILNYLGLAPVYIFLFRISVISSTLLVCLMSQINILFYLDKQRYVFYITLMFFLSNFILTIISIYLGPTFYGYGLAISLLCTNAFSVFYLMSSFKSLIYYSFMSI